MFTRKWDKIKSESPIIDDIRIELHGFCDALLALAPFHMYATLAAMGKLKLD